MSDLNNLRLCLHAIASHTEQNIAIAELREKVPLDRNALPRCITLLVDHQLVAPTGEPDGDLSCSSLSVNYRGLQLLTTLENPAYVTLIHRLPLSIGINVGISLGRDIDPKYMISRWFD